MKRLLRTFRIEPSNKKKTCERLKIKCQKYFASLAFTYNNDSCDVISTSNPASQKKSITIKQNSEMLFNSFFLSLEVLISH